MVRALCERLDPSRFDLTLIAGPLPASPAGQTAPPAGTPDQPAPAPGMTITQCPHLLRKISPLNDLRALISLRTILKKLRPDVVHTHTSKAGALGRIAARLAGRIPVIHSPHGHLYYGYYGRLRSSLIVLAERILAPLARRIAVLTDTERTDNLRRNIGKPAQYLTVPSGIDLNTFRPDPALRERTRTQLALADRFAIAWIGRLTHVKGPDIFIDACAHLAARLPNAAFVIAGDGNLRTAIKHRAHTSAIADRCRFLGHRNDIHAVLNASDALVLSSRNEGLGLTIIEAMACAVPVVATDVGGVRAVLQNGRCGLLVPPTSATPRDLANAVVRIAGDQTLRRNLILAGLARSKDFDLAAVVRRFADIYEELAAQ